MKYWANYRCAEHPDPADCPDNLIRFDEQTHEYGLYVHDGGSSHVSFAFGVWRSRSPGALDIRF